MRHERKKKQETRRKRAALLRQLDVLYPQRCDNCRKYQAKNISYTCDCDAYVKIREIGKQLDELLNPRKCESVELMDTLFVLENLTHPIYARLKYLGVTDKAIFEKVGVGHQVLTKWKKDNGIHKKYKKGVNV